MSRTSIKNWLTTALTESCQPAAAAPNPAWQGVLYQLGITTGDLAVLNDRPAIAMDIAAHLVVVINIPHTEERAKTSGGVYGERQNDVDVELEVVWMADLIGDPTASPPVPPAYPNQAAATARFDQILEGIGDTLRLAFFEKRAGGEYVGRGWPLTDGTGKNSVLKAMIPDVETFVNAPEVAENQQNPTYAAWMSFKLVEIHNALWS